MARVWWFWYTVCKTKKANLIHPIGLVDCVWGKETIVFPKKYCVKNSWLCCFCRLLVEYRFSGSASIPNIKWKRRTTETLVWWCWPSARWGLPFFVNVSLHISVYFLTAQRCWHQTAIQRSQPQKNVSEICRWSCGFMRQLWEPSVMLCIFFTFSLFFISDHKDALVSGLYNGRLSDPVHSKWFWRGSPIFWMLKNTPALHY